VRRVRVVVLSGGHEPAARAVAEVYPEADVDWLDKELLRGRARFRLLRHLRRKPCDRFVFFTYVNAWQLGRFAMALYGLLAGARRVAFVDVEHAVEDFGPARVLLGEAPRTALEYLLAGPVVLAGLAASWALGLAARPREGGYRRSAPSADRSLDVLFVRPTPTIGVMEAGESAHIRGVLDGLAALGHRPRVLSNDELPAIRRAGHPLEVARPRATFNATPLAFEVWNNFVFTLRLWREVRRARPDVVYQRYSRNSWAGVAVARLAGLPLLLEWNNSEVWATRHWSPVGWWARVVAVFEDVNRRGADRVVVVSRALAAELEAHGVDPARIVVNPNGVDPERFRPGAGGEAVRERYGLGDALVVGFVGSFNFYQGTPVLMRAATEVCREADARFLLVGYGELLGPTRAAAEEAGVTDRVVFTDRVPVDDVPAYVDACDVAVAPMTPNRDGSDFFNSPVKVFEYMAAGKAIVASRLGQIAEVIEEGETGLLVAPDSPGELAAAILRLARDPGLRRRLGEAARRAAVERHTWRRNAARVVETYDAVVMT
jgi:glycosyltransferase involved in cell wall biosynthesis